MRIVSFIGFFVILIVAYLFSENKKHVQWKTILWGVGLQYLAFILIIGVPSLHFNGPLKFLFDGANDFVNAIISYTNEGTKFIFGPLADTQKWGGIIFAVQILPTILFTATLMSVLYYLGIMQKIVRLMAWCMYKTMGISGAESLSNAANVFLGQTEAPLVIKPYLNRMTKSELLAIMVGGTASTAGGVLVAYVTFLKDLIPDIAGHLISASVLSAPAAFCAAKLMIPETSTPETMNRLPQEDEQLDSNIFEAAARGASEGMQLALNVGAMLLAFIALVALTNGILGFFGNVIGFNQWGQTLSFSGKSEPLSLQLIFSWLCSPFALLMGIPWSEAGIAGVFLGEKTVLNEFVAYVHMANSSHLMSVRTMTILAYALCGFANFSSIGILIGGIGLLAPNKKSDIAKLGLRAVMGGNLAAFMTACVAGVLL